MKPLISVIVPIYNVEKYLDECLLSIQQQTYPNLEVIMMNDGSTDGSFEIAKRYVDNDPRFHLHSQSNQGLSAARNNAFVYATGDFVSFVDSDDLLAIDYYETLIQAIEGYDILQIGYTRTSTTGESLTQKYPIHNYQFVSACLRLYRRDYFIKHNLQFEVGQLYEDIIFSIDLWSTKPRIRKINYAGYCYRLQPTSITAKRHNTRPIFNILSQRYKTASLRGKLLVVYTYLRLKTHFLLRR